MQTGFPTASQLHAISHGFSVVLIALPAVLVYSCIVAVSACLWWLAVVFLVRSLRLIQLRERELVFLELTPLAHADRTVQANRQFFTDLHGYDSVRGVMDKLLGLRIVFSVEIVGTREAGIRYIFCVPVGLKGDFMRAIHSFDPDIRLREVDDYLAAGGDKGQVATFRLKSRYYPLASQESYAGDDPVSYVLSSFSGLQADEMVALQLVLTPMKVRSAERISNRILHHHEHMDRVGKRRRTLGGSLARGISGMLFGVTVLVGEAVHGASRAGLQKDDGIARHKQHVAEGITPSRKMGALELQLASEVSDKLNQPLYAADIRLYVSGGNVGSKVNELRKAFNVYRTQYQGIVRRPDVWFSLRYRQYLMAHRLPSMVKSTGSILSTSEIAGIYHFPTGHSGDVVQSQSKTLPTPLGLRNRADAGDFAVLLGEGSYHGEKVAIGLTAAERERHVFVVGGTGNGKSTLLKYGVVQDIRNGKGVAVLDPHGDLAQDILGYVPEERIEDVIYFNPADLSYPVGLNILEVPAGLSGDALLDAKDFIAETVVSIMRKTFSDDASGGHRIEYVLRNTVLTALTVPEATLFTVYDILTDNTFRKEVVSRLEDEWLRNFWHNEFGGAGGFQQVKMMAGVTSKIGRYRASVSASRILSQPKSTINFDDILDGKILICNLAKGLIGEDTSEVLGIALLAELQLAAYRRIKQKRADRKPFYAYVDEFQNFATTSFVEMLSEARKYKLFLTMAEQTTSQQDDARMVNTILANAGTIVCFKTNSKADEEQMLHLFEPYLSKGQLASLPAYTFYAKLSGGLEPQEPLSGKTVVLEDDGDEAIARMIIQASRENYARRYVESSKTKRRSAGNDDQGGVEPSPEGTEGYKGKVLTDST